MHDYHEFTFVLSVWHKGAPPILVLCPCVLECRLRAARDLVARLDGAWLGKISHLKHLIMP